MIDGWDFTVLSRRKNDTGRCIENYKGPHGNVVDPKAARKTSLDRVRYRNEAYTCNGIRDVAIKKLIMQQSRYQLHKL